MNSAIGYSEGAEVPEDTIEDKINTLIKRLQFEHDKAKSIADTTQHTSLAASEIGKILAFSYCIGELQWILFKQKNNP